MRWSRGTLNGTDPLLYRAAPHSMQPVAMIDLRFVCTSFGWQPAVPQLMCATRKSPGFTNRTKSGDSWLSSVYDRTGFAPPAGHRCGFRGATCACSFVAQFALPPWQSVQPMRSVGLQCGSPTVWWQPTQLVDLAAASAAVCSMRRTFAHSGGIGNGSVGSVDQFGFCRSRVPSPCGRRTFRGTTGRGTFAVAGTTG